MNELEKKYEETRSKRMRVENELELLANNETVKRYFALSKVEDELFREESQIFQKIRFNEFENCEHLFVDTIESNEHNRFCACVKCGLDSTTLREDKSWLTPNRLASYNYIKEHLHSDYNLIRSKGTHTDLILPFETAQNIYHQVIFEHGNINDEQVAEYMREKFYHTQVTEMKPKSLVLKKKCSR